MNRRSFIRRMGYLGGSLALVFSGAPLKVFSAVDKISGRVTSAGKALADVLVSDGISIVKTDRNGKYSLDTAGKAGHVFVIIPSGYAFPVQRDIARFYHPFGATANYDFELEKLSQDDSRHNFLIWADPQVKNEQDVAELMGTSVPDAQELVKSLGNVPVHGIGVGDLVWDNHSLFPSYDESVAQIGIPFFQCMGNHDMDYRQGGDETSDVTFKKLYGPTCFSFNRGKAHYIVLDDVRYLGEDRKYDGFITQDKLDWIEKDLTFVPKDALVIICLHIPVHNSVKNNSELYRLLRDFKNVHVMSGHTHYNRNVIRDNVFEHNHGAVCGAWWTGPICSDGTPRGYGVYEVNGTDLKWYYKSTGLKKDVQLSIYVDKLNKQSRLLVNVWNWDPQWKIEYFLDGKPMGAPENQKGYDPQAVKLYKGEDMPKKRPFAEPSETDHLFMAHFDPKVKKVQVIVTDRFGQKYNADWT
ncbi:MAG: calcineurin-like phosphoesterase C-terminal domain-containing protein, partial [Mucilaginibacter polytrichastri]|nr:calcineurin-like phosphoesterase C-terminal domain-containing protein [Mucilaginibacter polytrichastri]